MWREQPLRESLSLLYRELADYCEAKYSMLTQHADPEKALPPLLVRQQKAVDLITQCYQQMHMLSAHRNNDYKRLLRAFQERSIYRNIFPLASTSRKRCKSWSNVATPNK